MKRRRVALMVMIDALGARFLRGVEFLPELPYRVGLRTVLGFSCSCQPTLLSGKMPSEHGHGAMYMRTDGETPLQHARRYAWLPPRIADNYRIRRRIEGHVRREVQGYFSLYEVPTRLLPHFDLVEHRSIFQPGALRRGHSIFDRLVELGLEFRSYDWRTPERENCQAVAADLQRGDVDFIFLYLPALDGLLHAHGAPSEPVLQHLRWYEGKLRELLNQAADVAEDIDFYLFSDHGMSNVHGGVDLMAPLEKRFGRNGDRYLAFYDSTMARFWVDDAALHDELSAWLDQRTEGRIVPDEEKAELGVDFPDRSQGDLIFVVNEGLILLPSYMGRQMLAGMHGYHPDAMHADACLLGLETPEGDLSHLRDLYHLMDAVAVRAAEARS